MNRGLALLVATLAAAPTPASARANDQFAFRIQLDTGKVTPLAPPPRGGLPLPPGPWPGTRTFVTHRQGRLAVYDQSFGSPNQLRFEVAIAPADGTLAWSLVHGRHAVFAWRSALPADGGTRDYRDRIGCLDLQTRRILWLREPALIGNGAAQPLTDDAVLLLHGRTLEIVRVTTGETLRSQPIVQWAPYAHPVQGGAALIGDGAALELVEQLGAPNAPGPAGPRTRWRISDAGSVGPIVPVDAPATCGANSFDPETLLAPPARPTNVDWLVYSTGTGTGTMSRIDPATGQRRYRVASDWMIAPCAAGDRLYEVWLRNVNGTSEITLVARRPSDGAVLRRYPVQRHYQVDIPGARVRLATPKFVEVETGWVVLD